MSGYSIPALKGCGTVANGCLQFACRPKVRSFCMKLRSMHSINVFVCSPHRLLLINNESSELVFHLVRSINVAQTPVCPTAARARQLAQRDPTYVARVRALINTPVDPHTPTHRRSSQAATLRHFHAGTKCEDKSDIFLFSFPFKNLFFLLRKLCSCS